ncbi:cyclase family protein [Anaerotignum sp. MB30-C6]|uniref:cyclase family protein n=1 Tax=Anaerotignum sp. MB30-C6 TaxID=3070814 RepID=UPI0027DE7D59|nr:cyclase family protein [Anaerotignum sp. MB30-C6]WMI80500.1 cyclase family protein [Anaerotignum sp. MB30-C6]
MRVVDLTRTISNTIPVYPGTEGPSLTIANTYEDSGFKETLLHMYSHTGTHMDAPHHIYPEGISLDKKDISGFVGKGCIIDARDLQAGGIIDISYIERNKERIEQAEFIIFQTGWEKYWGQEEYFGEYPVISKEVAQYLVEHNKKGIGLDNIGLDPISDVDLTLHHLMLANENMVIIENLCNLDLIEQGDFLFVALPLKFDSSDGAPIRAIAII